MKTKKAQTTIGGLQALVVPLIGIAIVLVVGFLIMAEAKTQVQSIDGVNSSGQNSSGVMNSYAFNGTATTQEAMADIPGWLPIIVITVIGALLLGLVAAFSGRR